MFKQTSLLCGLVLAASSVTAFAADKVTFQLDWLPGGDKAPIYVCIEKGFCAEEGIEATIAGGRGSSEAVTKLATGLSDIGLAGISAVMAAKAKGDVPVTAVMSKFNKGPHAFYTLEGNGIKEIKDVKGKKIATSPFTASNVFLPLVLADAGLTEADIELTKADPGSLGPLLMTGQVDAIIAWVTDVSRYQGQGETAGKKVTYLPWSAAGLDLYSASIVAADKFLTERPEVAKRFLKAYIKSVEYAKKNPAEAGKAVVAKVPELKAENVEGSFKDALPLIYNEVTEKNGLGTFDADRLAVTWERVSKAQGLDIKVLDPETLVDRSFLPAK